MSYLNNYLQSEALYGPWKVLHKEEQLEEMISLSHQKPVVIFKHSTRCGISAHAKYRLENEWGFQPEELEFYYLDLIAHRPISNRITQDFQVVHQSPQLIVLRHGKAVFDASHHLISAALLRQALEG